MSIGIVKGKSEGTEGDLNRRNTVEDSTFKQHFIEEYTFKNSIYLTLKENRIKKKTLFQITINMHII